MKRNLIDKRRKSINEIDEEILELLSKRNNLAKQIGNVKKSLEMPVFDKKREEEIMKKISKRAERLGLDKKFVKEVFRNIFKNSKASQKLHKNKA